MNTLTMRTKLIYAMGNLGIATITVMHMLHLVYFFFPPKGAGIPYLIPQQSLILGITAFGLVIGIGKIIDAFLDPMIANFSDRLNHRLGKRIPMMRLAALPFAMCYALVFFVPDTNGITNANILWMAAFLILSALFFTCYMIPFYSLMVDIAKTSEEKVDLSTISSALWFVGFILVSFTPELWGVFVDVLEVDRLSSVKTTFSLTALFGFLCLMVPALLINETEHTLGQPEPLTKSVREQQKLIPSLRRVLRNRSFRFYLVANTFYTISTIIFEGGLLYYITVLARLDEGLQGPSTILIGGLTLACYPLVNIYAKKVGKSAILKLSLFMFALTFITISSFGLSGIHNYFLFAVLLLLLPFAQAAFGILPHVITSDCAAYDQYKSGEDSAGMYMAANGFCVKLGASIGLIIFTSLLLFGKDIGNDMGIRFATLFAGGISFLGILFLTQYDEKEILSYASVEGQQ